jgi:hypothetical protein
MPVILQYVTTNKPGETNSKKIEMTIDNNVVYTFRQLNQSRVGKL